MENPRVTAVLALCCLVAGGAWASIDHGTLGVADTATVTNILQVTDNAWDDEAQSWGPYPWSADGQRILYTSEVDADDYMENEICVIGVDGTGWQRITDNSTCDSHASFTPDGRIVFQRRDPATSDGRIWIMNADGSGQVNLTDAHGGPVNGVDTCENKPAVSPDGTKIAFHTCDEDIWVMNIDGSNPIEVAAITNSNKHVWGVNSQWVYFNCDTTDDMEIWRAAADGSGMSLLSDSTDGDCANWPSVSPNGQWIAYHQDDDDGLGDGYTIRLMAPDGTSKRILVDGGGATVGGPNSWSPNSEWVTYIMWGAIGRELHIINVNTLENRQLTVSYNDERPWWSPDGACILFRDNGGTVRDGGTLQDDLLVVNLTDPSLFAQQVIQGAAIPTLGSLGTMLLVLLTAGAGVFALRRWLA